jgi:hypothetical protein
MPPEARRARAARCTIARTRLVDPMTMSDLAAMLLMVLATLIALSVIWGTYFRRTWLGDGVDAPGLPRAFLHSLQRSLTGSDFARLDARGLSGAALLALASPARSVPRFLSLPARVPAPSPAVDAC